MVCLDSINSNNGREWSRGSHTDAYSLMLAFQKFSFAVSLVILKEILAIRKPSSVLLLGVTLILHELIKMWMELKGK